MVGKGTGRLLRRKDATEGAKWLLGVPFPLTPGFALDRPEHFQETPFSEEVTRKNRVPIREEVDEKIAGIAPHSAHNEARAQTKGARRAISQSPVPAP